MSKKDKLQELIEVIGIRKNTVKMRDQISETILAPTIHQLMSGLEDDEAIEVMAEINAFKKTYLQKISALDEESISCIVALYDKHFSEEEIDHIIDFYTSPAGKKSVELAPMFVKKVTELSVKNAEKILREMEEKEEEEEEREMKK